MTSHSRPYWSAARLSLLYSEELDRPETPVVDNGDMLISQIDFTQDSYLGTHIVIPAATVEPRNTLVENFQHNELLFKPAQGDIGRGIATLEPYGVSKIVEMCEVEPVGSRIASELTCLRGWIKAWEDHFKAAIDEVANIPVEWNSYAVNNMFVLIPHELAGMLSTLLANMRSNMAHGKKMDFHGARCVKHIDAVLALVQTDVLDSIENGFAFVSMASVVQRSVLL